MIHLALKMASPWKHPKTGVYWFRRRVPGALRPLVGKTIVQKTLDTKDPAEAKKRFLPIALAISREWARLAAMAQVRPKPPEKLEPMEIEGLAGEFYRWFVAKHERNPGQADEWRKAIEDDMRQMHPSGRRPPATVSLYLPQVQEVLAEREIIVDDEALWDLAFAAARAGIIAKERLVRMAQRDYSGDPAAEKFPKFDDVKAHLSIRSQMLTLEEHFDEFAKTKAPASRKKYRGCLNDLVKFLGDPNLADATPELIQEWIDDLASRMVGEGQDAKRKIGDKNLKEGYLTSARSFFSWAVKKRKIASNPAEDIDIAVEPKVEERPPYFDDDEVNTILSEALRPSSSHVSPEFAAAKRWIPWLSAYTGARVNELTQLRGQDVRERRLADEVVWTINITPAAGRVKTRRAREVPLHPHLVEQGFPAFARAKGDGPLFYDPARRRGGTDENPLNRKVGDKLAEWVRKIGIEKGVAPNHGWRHRFNAVGRRVHMIPEIRDGIKGHKARTEGEMYGGYIEWDMMWPEIKLMPRIEVQPATGPLPHSEARAKATRTRAATRGRATARRKASAAAE